MDGRTWVFCEYKNKVSHEIWRDGQGYCVSTITKFHMKYGRMDRGYSVNTITKFRMKYGGTDRGYSVSTITKFHMKYGGTARGYYYLPSKLCLLGQ